jgi:hypothetical protein
MQKLDQSLDNWSLQLTKRTVIAGCMVAVGLGRMGFYTFKSITFGEGAAYGTALVAMALSVMLTNGPKAHSIAGRISAGISAGLLATMAVDVWASIGSVNTSTVTLLWLSAVLFNEAGTRYHVK